MNQGVCSGPKVERTGEFALGSLPSVLLSPPSCFPLRPAFPSVLLSPAFPRPAFPPDSLSGSVVGSKSNQGCCPKGSQGNLAISSTERCIFPVKRCIYPALASVGALFFPLLLATLNTFFDLRETLGTECSKAASRCTWRAWNTSDFTSIT
jgi:hypothetical protein